MAQTITEINDNLKASYIEKLGILYGISPQGNMTEQFNGNFSKASIEAVLLYIVAVAIAALENMFDWFKRDVTQIVENERYGYAGWYEKMAKLFRHGQGISDVYSQNPSSPFAESAIYSDAGLTADDIAELQVVKYAFATDSPTGIGVVMKIAGENNGEITQLNSQQLKAFTGYMNRIKPAGIPVNIINEPAETLRINLKVWYNPLILNADGETIATGIKPVEEAVKTYLKSIEFAGEFVVMRMIDSIQKIEGVTVVSFKSATATAGSKVTNITERYTPGSGYLKLATDNTVLEYECEK